MLKKRLEMEDLHNDMMPWLIGNAFPLNAQWKTWRHAFSSLNLAHAEPEHASILREEVDAIVKEEWTKTAIDHQIDQMIKIDSVLRVLTRQGNA